MSELFGLLDLRNFVREDVSLASFQVAERVAWGWLRPILDVDERPASVSPELFAWALELGAIAHENPTGLTQYQLGEERRAFSAERRSEILAEAVARSTVAGGAAPPNSPQGSFPEPLAWPDPIRCWVR